MSKRKEPVYLRGKKVILRPLRRETDIEQCYIWINDSELTHFLIVDRPISFPQEQAWFDNMMSDKSSIHFAICTLNGEYIGNITLTKLNWVDGTASVGCFIGNKTHRSTGYGADAMMLIASYAFGRLNLRKLNAGIYSFNKASLRCSEKCGYTVEGVRKQQIYRNFRYYDEVVMAVFKKDWLNIWREFKKTSTLK